MSTADSIQFATVIITGTGVLIALFTLVWQSYQTREQMKLNFFADYTKRYQEIVLHLPNNLSDPNFDFEKMSVQDKEHALRYIRIYFDLCSEEFYLKKSGKIDRKVWKEWESGIAFAFSKKGIKDAWHIINLDAKFYGEFVEWVNTQILK